MKSVVLIGATQGTGRKLAAEYARRGANVVITGRSAEPTVCRHCWEQGTRSLP